MDNHEGDVLWGEIYHGIAKAMAFTDAGVDDVTRLVLAMVIAFVVTSLILGMEKTRR